MVQVLVIGKISQAAILAAAAYRDHETFKRQTGITNCRLIYDREHHDTKVLLRTFDSLTGVASYVSFCQLSCNNIMSFEGASQ